MTAHLLDSFGALDKLQAFVSTNGRTFYGLPLTPAKGPLSEVILRKVESKEVEVQFSLGKQTVVPFMAGKKLDWEIVN